MLLQEQERGIEETLWAALRMMEERATMLQHMIHDEETSGRSRMASNYEDRARESQLHADRIRKLLQQQQS